jgi:hypothetical protein
MIKSRIIHFALGPVLLALGLLALPARATEVHVLVRPTVSGTDMVYDYELVNHGTSRVQRLAIGVTPADTYSPWGWSAPSLGTLTRLPTGTLWEPAPAMQREDPTLPDPRAGRFIPVPPAGSLASPPGWWAEVGGAVRVRADKAPEHIAYERYAIGWDFPMPGYGDNPDHPDGINAGQRRTGFSVRVPQDSTTGPGSVGTLTDYTSGRFYVDFWFGTDSLNDPTDLNKTYRRSDKITLSPTLELSFTTVPDLYWGPVLPESLVAVTANILPLVYGNEPSPAIRLESITCWGDCASNAGVTGADFGTDDRTFQLQAAYHRLSDGRLRRYRMYDVVYSIADAAGTRNTVKSTIEIMSRNPRR